MTEDLTFGAVPGEAPTPPTLGAEDEIDPVEDELDPAEDDIDTVEEGLDPAEALGCVVQLGCRDEQGVTPCQVRGALGDRDPFVR